MTNFMVTRSGIEFDFDNPTKDMIRISDIAFSLSRQRRFNGHTLVNASVALHSVIVSHIVPRQYAIYGLLHNAHEAYTGDITTPVKRFCKPEITELECRIDKAIYERFGLSEPTQDVRDKVRHADLSHLLHEKIEYLPQSPTNWGISSYIDAESVDRLENYYHIHSPEQHELLFWRRLDELNKLQ